MQRLVTIFMMNFERKGLKGVLGHTIKTRNYLLHPPIHPFFIFSISLCTTLRDFHASKCMLSFHTLTCRLWLVCWSYTHICWQFGQPVANICKNNLSLNWINKWKTMCLKTNVVVKILISNGSCIWYKTFELSRVTILSLCCSLFNFQLLATTSSSSIICKLGINEKSWNCCAKNKDMPGHASFWFDSWHKHKRDKLLRTLGGTHK